MVAFQLSRQSEALAVRAPPPPTPQLYGRKEKPSLGVRSEEWGKDGVAFGVTLALHCFKRIERRSRERGGGQEE